MSDRINFGKNTPLSFRENIRFSRECPYKIRYKDFANDDIAPLHYAETVEIGVCCGITGELVVGDERLELCKDIVYVIPPGTVHAASIRKGMGHVYVLHISLEALSDFINVEALLEQSGKTFSGMPYLCPAFDQIRQLILEMIQRDAEPFTCMRALMRILEILSEQMPSGEEANQSQAESRNDELCHILRWTEKHFTDQIRLEQAAAVIGFTKNYFCTWFKSNTGLTYNQYLNHLRINNACRLLIKTESIASACYDSGFRDMSYFIQVFKKTQGCTPRVYILNSKKHAP